MRHLLTIVLAVVSLAAASAAYADFRSQPVTATGTVQVAAQWANDLTQPAPTPPPTTTTLTTTTATPPPTTARAPTHRFKLTPKPKPAPRRPWFTRHLAQHTYNGTVTFRFTNGQRGMHYECRLDRGSWRLCKNPRRLRVPTGRYTFYVRAVADTIHSAAIHHTFLEQKRPQPPHKTGSPLGVG
jgi:hypothetical protein